MQAGTKRRRCHSTIVDYRCQRRRQVSSSVRMCQGSRKNTKKKVRIQKKGEQRRINYLRRTGINILEIQYWNTVISYWRAPRIYIVLYLFTRGTTVVYCTGKYCSRTHCREKSLELYRTMDSTTIHNLIDTTTDRYEWESLLKMKDEWFGWKHKISLSQSEHDLIRYIVRKEKLIVPLSHWRE